MLRFFSILVVTLITASCLAASELPKNLNAVERETALGVLGFGSASKLLSSPYPLGGYDGIEVGLSSEYIPMSDVASLGAKSTSRSDLNYLNLSLGKGLFYNLDILVNFITPVQEESLAGFGGQLRWGFYETKFMPAALSLVVHGSAVNFSNLVGAQTTGVDLIGSVNMRDVSLFFGVGQARSVGTFIGGTEGLTDTGNTESADMVTQHTVFGISIKMSRAFVALEIDRYMQSTYAGRVGFRF